jgi:hypothetical protein
MEITCARSFGGSYVSGDRRDGKRDHGDRNRDHLDDRRGFGGLQFATAGRSACTVCHSAAMGSFRPHRERRRGESEDPKDHTHPKPTDSATPHNPFYATCVANSQTFRTDLRGDLATEPGVRRGKRRHLVGDARTSPTSGSFTAIQRVPGPVEEIFLAVHRTQDPVDAFDLLTIQNCYDLKSFSGAEVLLSEGFRARFTHRERISPFLEEKCGPGFFFVGPLETICI